MMDPAGAESEWSHVQRAVSQQGALLGSHEQSIHTRFNNNQALNCQISELASQVSALLSLHSQDRQSPSLAPSSPELRDSKATGPEPCSGQPQ